MLAEDRAKPAASAPPIKKRVSIAKPHRQRTVNTEHKSTQGNTSCDVITTSHFGKRSVDDIWDDLFQMEGSLAFADTSLRVHAQERSTRPFGDTQAKSYIDISNRGVEGTNFANREKLVANAILGVSLAYARASAAALDEPLYRHLARLSGNDAERFVMPVSLAVQFSIPHNEIHGFQTTAKENHFRNRVQNLVQKTLSTTNHCFH